MSLRTGDETLHLMFDILLQKQANSSSIDVKPPLQLPKSGASLGDEGMFTTANILQITDVVRRVVFSLFLLCVYPVVGLFILRETCKIFRRFVLLYQNNVTSSQGFSVAVHFSAINAVLLTRPFHISETSFTFGDC